MAASPAALLPPFLTLVVPDTLAQVYPDYHYFGQQGDLDPWELLRLQHQKGKGRRRGARRTARGADAATG